MDYKRMGLILVGLLVAILGIAQEGFANKSSVTIEAPASAQKGSEIVIRLHISHEGNSFIHYTNWVYLKVNGKEVARWEFNSSNRPEAGNFSKEVKFLLNESLEIVAEANCVLHGSPGAARSTVTAN